MKYPWTQIFIVNLDTDKDRLENVSKQFSSIGMSLRKLSNRREDDWRDAPASSKCRLYCDRSTIGSYYGHYKLWKTMIDENIQSALIVEDDVTLDDDFTTKFQKYFEYVPSDWDMVFLGCTLMCKRNNTIYDQMTKLTAYRNSNDNYPINEYINKILSFAGLHAYIINLKMAKRLIEASNEIDDNIEIQISRYLSRNMDLNVYAFEDYIVTQNLFLYESVNNTGRIPNLINKTSDNIFVVDQNNYKISLAYILNVPFYPYKILGYRINILLILLFLFGVVLGLFLNIKYALMISVLFIFFDIFYSSLLLKTNINYKSYIHIWLIILFGIVVASGLSRLVRS